MFDYRNDLKRILQKTAGDDQSLQNSLTAIKAIIAMADDGKNTKPVKTKPVKTASIAQNNSNAKQVKQLLNGLTALIEAPGNPEAKKQTLSALHKLTFVPGVGKNYGKELGRLDQAVQTAVETKEAVNSKIFKEAMKPVEKPKRDYRKGRRYTVIRLVSGADLINDNGETVLTVKESQVHPLNLKTGDIVEALEDKTNPNYEAEILRVVGFRKMRKRDYDQIADFKYAVVQGRPGHLSISRNIRGEKLHIRGKAITLAVDSSYYQGENIHLEDGSIVDLAWYEGDVRLKKNPADAVQIRWIYEVDPPKRIANTKKKKDKSNSESDEEIAKLDLDLHYQRVGIAIGDNQNEAILEGIVTRYHGIPIPIDAFEGKKKVIEKQIKDLDIVVLVTAFAAHDSTWNIREFASKYGVKFAVSSSKGYQSFERALYRADQGLPAYEGNQRIDYQMKK
ncbi:MULTISPECIES: DUF2325 domain-containing protein [Lactobacillus]|uniref:DUF2325 domain-containing protein n=1 Tax=Lactobacillus xujianguonis TaxID=2495899 RepID=A0A437SXM3_9LACO|nr:MULTISPECIES: DUF2325 domain-containing protein [Lactobacillus]RVU71666.1 DUF2325 domain-containing protein [Lactobacillus xujianguonis]RVU77683.1 DUF2325 domain-containing protein [Lactobacillus xujianguonis]